MEHEIQFELGVEAAVFSCGDKLFECCRCCVSSFGWGANQEPS